VVLIIPWSQVRVLVDPPLHFVRAGPHRTIPAFAEATAFMAARSSASPSQAFTLVGPPLHFVRAGPHRTIPAFADATAFMAARSSASPSQPISATQTLAKLTVDSGGNIQTLTLHMRCVATNLAFSVQPLTQADETRDFLLSGRYVFSDWPLREANGQLVGMRFSMAELAIPASITIYADIDNSCLLFYSKNMDGFQNHREIVRAQDLDSVWLDRLGRHLLGQGRLPAHSWQYRSTDNHDLDGSSERRVGNPLLPRGELNLQEDHIRPVAPETEYGRMLPMLERRLPNELRSMKRIPACQGSMGESRAFKTRVSIQRFFGKN